MTKVAKIAKVRKRLSLQTVNTAVKWVVLGIYGFDAGEFTVAAWTTSPLVLLEGQAVMGQVDKHKYRYFKFHVETTADITITLTPLSGDVDLYVANGEKYSHPDKTICQSGHLTNETWCSRKPAMRVDVVKMIQAPAPYEYIIAVYGFSNSTYTIQGRTILAIIQLFHWIKVYHKQMKLMQMDGDIIGSWHQQHIMVVHYAL